MKIDCHCHAFPHATLRELVRCYPEQMRITEDRGAALAVSSALASFRALEPARRLAEIDAAGIEMEVVSGPQAYIGLDDRLGALCRSINDGYAEVCARYPQRLRAFMNLPFTDLDAALLELERVRKLPGFAGIALATNVDGVYFDHPRYEPFWAAVNRDRIPVFMHPLNSNCYRDEERPGLLAYPFETTLAVMRLVVRGLFERFPDVILIAAHLGGTLPFLASRIDLGFQMPAALGTPEWHTARPPSEQMKKLYFDTALAYRRGALECARELVGIDHLLFGTDHYMPGPRSSKIRSNLWSGSRLRRPSAS